MSPKSIAVAIVALIAASTFAVADTFGTQLIDFAAPDEASRWSGVGGEWVFDGGALSQQVANQYWNIHLRDGQIADSSLSVRCRLLEVFESYAAAGYITIAFRAQDEGHYYCVHVKRTGDLNLLEYCRPASEGRSIWQVTGSYKLLQEKLPLDAWYRVDIETRASKLRARAYPEGETAPDWQITVDLDSADEIDHAGDEAYLSGRLGFGTSNCRAEFADLVVEAFPSLAPLRQRLSRLTSQTEKLLPVASAAGQEDAVASVLRDAAALGDELEKLAELNEARYETFDGRLEALGKRLREARRAVVIAKGGLRAACEYADALELPQYKANLHCHTRHSDGSLFCDDMAKWYEEHGYQILAMTDHDAYGEQDGGVASAAFQNDTEVHDWDGDGKLHAEREYRSGIEAYVRDYSSPAPAYVPRNWKLNRPGEFVVLNSMECSFGHAHTNVIEPPTGSIPRPRESYEFIDWCHSNDGVVFVDHAAAWNSSPGNIADHEHMSKIDGVEVLNGFTARDNRSGANPSGVPGIADGLWNGCLDAGKRLWGFANDDAHNVTPDSFAGSGSAWNQVWCKELTRQAVMESLRQGAFYATCGIEIDRVEITPETITVHSPNATHARVVSDGGATVAQVDGPEITYSLSGEESWIRVELWNDTMCYAPPEPQFPQKAWLQPIMLGSLLDD